MTFQHLNAFNTSLSSVGETRTRLPVMLAPSPEVSVSVVSSRKRGML